MAKLWLKLIQRWRDNHRMKHMSYPTKMVARWLRYKESLPNQHVEEQPTMPYSIANLIQEYKHRR